MTNERKRELYTSSRHPPTWQEAPATLCPHPPARNYFIPSNEQRCDVGALRIDTCPAVSRGHQALSYQRFVSWGPRRVGLASNEALVFHSPVPQNKRWDGRGRRAIRIRRQIRKAEAVPRRALVRVRWRATHGWIRKGGRLHVRLWTT
jgi:hypothetical protein